MVAEHEHRVFVGLIEDILRATPGLVYELEFNDRPDDGDDAPYATFRIATNPSHELSVVIELTRRAFTFRVNGDAYPIPVERVRRIERWFDRRCRDVERLVAGDLRIEEETLFGRYLSSDLFAGKDGNWTDLADRDDGWGWIGLLGLVIPFGLSPMRTRDTVYEDWFRTDTA